MADLPITSDQGATPIVINDPTTTANVANVKAASTAAVVADNSLVVALSPNSPVPAGTNKIGVTGVAQASTTSGQNGDLVQGAVTTAAPTYVTAQTSPLSLTTAGDLRCVSKIEDTAGNTLNSTSGALNVSTISSVSGMVTANEVYTVATLLNQATANTDNPLVLIKNPLGSGKTLYLYKLALGCTVANVSVVFHLFSDPTVTANGTVFTPVSNNIGGGAGASAMQVFTLPTVSADGTSFDAYTYGQNSNSLNVFQEFSIHLTAGHSLMVTGSPASNGRQATVTVVWAEI